MDKKERHIRENEARERREADLDRERGYQTPEEISNNLRANGKNRKRNNTARINRLWLWLGVICLILILIWWLFSMGILEDSLGIFNGN